jgi:hypothetical protein
MEIDKDVIEKLIICLPIKPDPIPIVNNAKFFSELKKVGLDKYLIQINDKNKSSTLGKNC